MDYFVMLLLVYSILFIVSIPVFNLKVLSPSIIFTTSFTFMVFLAFFTRDEMGFAVSEKTFEVLAIGGMLFVFTELFVMLFYRLRIRSSIYGATEIERKPLYMRKSTINFFFIVIAASFALALVSIALSTSGSVGYRMEVYKNMMLYDTGNVRFRFLLNQLYKLNTASAYICSYIAIYNWSVCKETLKKQIKYLWVSFIFIFYTLFSQGARQPAIEIIVFMVLVYFAWKLKKSDKQRVISVISKLIVIAPMAAVIFTQTAEMVGRRHADRTVLKYISTYFCGGLYSFNLHINEPARNIIWGQSSFADIYQFLNKFDIVPDSYVASYHTFDLYGNTVTMFGRWYEDFGSVGVYTMSIFSALFFSVLFYKYLFPQSGNQKWHLSKIIYCKLIIVLVWAGYDDRIRALFSMSNVLMLIMMCIIYYSFVVHHLHFKIGGGYFNTQIGDDLAYCYRVMETVNGAVEVAFSRNSKWRVAV